MTEHFVKAQGLSVGGAKQLSQRLAEAGTLPRTQQLSAELLQFVMDEEAKAKVGERLVGSREVIESIFGKWKRLEGERPRSGLTSLVLALGAIVSQTTADVVREALITVPTKAVLTWCQEKLGKTLHATRRSLSEGQRWVQEKGNPNEGKFWLNFCPISDKERGMRSDQLLFPSFGWTSLMSVCGAGYSKSP